RLGSPAPLPPRRAAVSSKSASVHPYTREMPWNAGGIVALRDIWFGAVWRAVAGIVVEETEQRSVFWIPVGSESVYPADGDGHEIRIPRRTFTHAVRLTKRPI